MRRTVIENELGEGGAVGWITGGTRMVVKIARPRAKIRRICGFVYTFERLTNREIRVYTIFVYRIRKIWIFVFKSTLRVVIKWNRKIFEFEFE